MSKEALKLALEALEGYESCIDAYYAGAVCPQIDKAITAIKEALAQPEQEPLAMEFKTDAEKIAYAFGWFKALELNRAQRTWVGLTDEEVRQMCGSVPSMKEAVREAEAKLKEKNT